MKKIVPIFLCVFYALTAFAQSPDTAGIKASVPEKNALKFNINADGSHYFQVVFMNQVWARFNESNPGTTQFSKSSPITFDIGLRRTRMQLFGQISDRTFVYFQFGQNNYNAAYNYSSPALLTNRKLAAFFHDALCEFKLTKGNQLKIGGGLTVLNGLSRFSQPSVGSIMTLDVPVFLQYSVDQTDQFDRRLALYARGLLGKFDYRFYVSNPFPVNSNGNTPPGLSFNAQFVNPALFQNANGSPLRNSPGINNQFGGYVAYNFFDTEPHTTPYMTGTYLGGKKVWNIAAGAVYQKDATMRLHTNEALTANDTVFDAMLHLGVETFLDLPLNKDNGSALNFFAGFYNTSYGKNYLRYNGIMNPSTGLAPAATPTAYVTTGGSFGNAFPMFGTGKVIYTQLGFLLPKDLLGEGHGQLMPYASAQYADYNALQNRTMVVFDLGLNWFIKGHNSKLSLDYQNRPTYYLDASKTVTAGKRKSCIILQYQISF